MINPAEVIAQARTWAGVPFLHQGRTRKGVDCIGLVICVSRDLGVFPIDFDRNGYGRLPDSNMLETEVAAQCTRIDRPEPGSLLVMRFKKFAQHFALFTENDSIIHAYAGVKKVVEVGYRGAWPRRTMSCWRLPGVKYE